MAEQYLLQEGDIIRLEKGMKVYTAIPEKFLWCSNAPFSSKVQEVVVNIGEVRCKTLIYNREALSKKLTEEIQKLVQSNNVTEEKVCNFVDSLGLDFSPEELDTSVYAGEYRVYQTRLEKREFGPDAWHVYCKKINNPALHVHFYQTGISYPMILGIKPIIHEH